MKINRSSNKVIAGVAAGLADHFDINVVPLRILFVILGFNAGLGVILYLILWMLMPDYK